MSFVARAVLLALALGVPAGCGAVRSLNTAAESLDVYELTPTSQASGGARSGRSLAIETPSAPAAIATERILVKPNPLAVTYLGGARWVEPAPAHVQSLLARSLAGSGRVGMVSTTATGPLPDYDLVTSIEDFQAEITPGAEPGVEVVIAMTMTLVRDIDARPVGARRFEARVAANSDAPTDIVSAFNQAMSAVLREATGWTISAMAGGGV
jgi:cholesterol transport system auxiliary component